MDKDVCLVKPTVNVLNKTHVLHVFQATLMMLFSKIVFNVPQQVILSMQAAVNAAIKFKVQALFVPHVLQEIMYFLKEANV